VARSLGPIVGWKVGSATLQSEPFRAGIHADMLFNETDRIAASVFHVIGVEAEIAYSFACDLPSERAMMDLVRSFTARGIAVLLISHQLGAVADHVGTLVVVAGFIGRSIPPRLLGIPYVKETR